MSGLRGIALIVVVGVLGVLAVLATAFVTMAQLERKASLQRVKAVKASLLARSGIEDALARLGMKQDPLAARNFYQGENWDGDSNDALSAFEAQQEVYSITGTGTSADTDACPVRDAMRPSFFAGDPSDPARNPLLVSVDGRRRGFTGSLSDDQASKGNTYALRVFSEDGIDVNGGDVSPGDSDGDGIPNSQDPDYNGVPTYNSTLRTMLGNLAAEIYLEDGTQPVRRADGWGLIDNRPSGGWTSFDQIRDHAFPGRPTGKWQALADAFRPYLTLHAWMDKHVITPNVMPGMEGKQYKSWGEIKLDHALNPSAANSHAPDFEKVGGRNIGRAPVSLAWARHHKPALVALLSGLKGLYLDESYLAIASWVSPADHCGTMRSAEIGNTGSKTDDCHKVADAILALTSDITTWQQWNAFCDTLVLSGVNPDEAQAKQDVLKANFNPNSDLNKFNPNNTLWKLVDKSDLLAYSTEFSLFPVQGYEVESVGRVLGPGGRLLASRVFKATIGSPSMVRLSTQREFVCDNLGDLDTPGDETLPRKPGYQLGGNEAFVSQSQAVLADAYPQQRTWGHTLDTTGLLPASNYGPGSGNWMNGNSMGAAVQVYPEPYVNSGSGLSINPADYDGNLQLATVETAKDDFYTVAAATERMTMLARFDDTFDLGVPATGVSELCKPGPLQATTAQLGTGLLKETSASSGIVDTLYPDGAYSEKDRAPAFFDAGNAPSFHAVLSVWAKPNYRTQDSTWTQRGHAWIMDTNWSDNTPGKQQSSDQFFFLGDKRQVGDIDGVALQFELGHATADANQERRFQSGIKPFSAPPQRPAPKPHTWCLATVAWDFLVLNKGDAGEAMFNDWVWAVGNTDQYSTSTETSDAWQEAADITVPDLGGAHLMSLGAMDPRDANKNLMFYIGQGADTTFDELAVYDFGGVPPPGGTSPPADARSAPPTLAFARYHLGRYYKGSTGYRKPGDAYPASDEAASWISAPINLPSGMSLKTLAWTWYRPDALPDDYAELELLNPGASDYFYPAPPSVPNPLCRSTQAPGWSPDRQSWDVLEPPSGPFRIRVVFERKTSVGQFTPILDSPVLDDLTLILSPPGGPRLLSWEGVDSD